jgi:hypothetical protein
MHDETGAPISVDFGGSASNSRANLAAGFVVPEQEPKPTSPEKRLMREKSDETMIREQVTRDELVKLARNRKTEKTNPQTMSKLTQILENRGRFKRRHSRKEDQFWK